MSPARLSGLLIAVSMLAGPVSLAQTTQPATTRPIIDIWNEPTDVPTPKTDRYGVVDPQFAKLHEQFVQRAKEGNVGLLFLGDSITNGWFWGNNKEIWDEHFGQYNPANFGIGGDRTEHVLWRIQNGELDGIHPKVVVLLIGTNNIGYSAEDIAKGVSAVVNEIHERLPESKLILMAIFPRADGKTDEGDKGMQAKIAQVNQAIAKLADGERTRFLDIREKLQQPDGTIPESIMPDQLHLNYAGYEIWADALTPVIEEMMK